MDQKESSYLEILTVRPRQAAAMLNISLRKFNDLRAAGKLPPSIKLDGIILYIVEDLKLWLTNGCPNCEDFKIIKTNKTFSKIK